MLDEDRACEVDILVREGIEETNVWFTFSDCMPDNLVDTRTLISEIGAIAAVPYDVDLGIIIIIVIAGLSEKVRCVLRVNSEVNIQ